VHVARVEELKTTKNVSSETLNEMGPVERLAVKAKYNIKAYS